MAKFENKTTLAGKTLIDPQVLAEFLDVKMMDAIKFAPLCNVNRDLEGRPGSTLTLPMYKFVGFAEDVAEGADIPMNELGTESVNVKVKKAGKGVSISDEAILSAYGDPVNEIAKQLLMAIAGKVDNDCIGAIRGTKVVVQDGQYVDQPLTEADEDKKITDARNERKLAVGRAFDKYVISEMITMFGEDLEEDMTVMINPAHLAELRKDKDFVQVMAGQAIISGEIGQIFGCRVVVSNKVKEDEAFLVKAGAVEILMKRNVMVESDRDIVNKTNAYVVDEHYAVYLKQPEKIVIATGITKPQA
jgi:N4-gp56 family major capsid protein